MASNAELRATALHALEMLNKERRVITSVVYTVAQVPALLDRIAELEAALLQGGGCPTCRGTGIAEAACYADAGHTPDNCVVAIPCHHCHGTGINDAVAELLRQIGVDARDE